MNEINYTIIWSIVAGGVTVVIPGLVMLFRHLDKQPVKDSELRNSEYLNIKFKETENNLEKIKADYLLDIKDHNREHKTTDAKIIKLEIEVRNTKDEIREIKSDKKYSEEMNNKTANILKTLNEQVQDLL